MVVKRAVLDVVEAVSALHLKGANCVSPGATLAEDDHFWVQMSTDERVIGADTPLQRTTTTNRVSRHELAQLQSASHAGVADLQP